MKVYAELEATPDRGREFASAIRHLMQARSHCIEGLCMCAGWLGLWAACCLPRCQQPRAVRHAPPNAGMLLTSRPRTLTQCVVGGRVGGVEAEQLPRRATGAPAGRGASRGCRCRSRCVCLL